MTDERSKSNQPGRKGLRACFIYYMRFNGSAILYREAKSLKDKGFDVDIICLRDTRKENAFQVYEGINLYGIQPREEREKKTSVYFERLIAFCIKATAMMTWLGMKRKYDIVHVTTPPDFLVYAAFLPKLRGAKIILDIHDIGPELFMRKLHKPETGLIIKMLKYFERKAASFSNHVITVTDLWRDKLVSRSVPAAKCTSILNVPDDNLFRAYTTAEKGESDKIRLSYHGSLEEHFGVDSLISAMPDIKKQVPEAELVIYGMGRIRDELVEEIRKNDMSGYVRINDFVPFHTLPDVLREADIGIVPTKADVFSGEALSMKALEYMSLGIPVVVSRTPVHDYYYNDSMVQFFLPSDRKDLTRAVVELCKDKAARIRLADNAKTFIRKHGWQAARKTYYSIIDRLLNPPAGHQSHIFDMRRFTLLKPFIPRRLQIMIRKALVDWRLPAFKDVWPIDPASNRKPEGWTGWPDGKKFAFVITHDVDSQKGIDKTRSLAEIDTRLGFHSSFNFVAERYEISSELLKELSDKGCEIGQHGINHTNPFLTRKIFLEQTGKINRYLREWNAVGFRSPSMYHNLEWIHELNIEYDASTFDTDPFEPQSDGAGTTFPFWVPGNSPQKGYVELPYTLPQDFLLFILMKQKNTDTWKTKLDWIVKNGGMALFITHPDYMSFGESHPANDEYPAHYYEEFLEYIKREYKDQYWHVLPRDLARWWSDNYGKKTPASDPSNAATEDNKETPHG